MRTLPERKYVYSVILLFLITLSARLAVAADSYNQDTVIKDAAEFLGAGAEGVGDVIEKIFSDLGKPNAVIKGEEASGALGIGARYGNGQLQTAAGQSREVHWTGPSIGFDAGANVSKVYVLVYRLPAIERIFQRFPAVDGSIYVVGGISANYHQSGDIILAPIRLGAGLRAGVNVGYMKYTPEKTWNPF
ncbi:MAG: DUF1134 domain-containing protein [Thiotrichales bacterium]|nr:DUF1134 domain-containing protein [Thiotrichales bacterium]